MDGLDGVLKTEAASAFLRIKPESVGETLIDREAVRRNVPEPCAYDGTRSHRELDTLYVVARTALALAQGRLGKLARGHVTEQDRDLAEAFSLDTGC